MTKDEFLNEIRKEFPFDAFQGTPTEVAEFIWNRWLYLYHEGFPINPGKAWGAKSKSTLSNSEAERLAWDSLTEDQKRTAAGSPFGYTVLRDAVERIREEHEAKH